MNTSNDIRDEAQRSRSQPSTCDNGGQRRNLIMFMPDQLRYDSLGCTGNPVVKTPFFDKLAAEGTLFTNCFTQATVCTQSRCSMFTGQYQHTSAHRSINDLLKPWEDNMFKVLKDDGYHVCAIAERGDLFGPGVTELNVDEYGPIEHPPNWPPGSANKDAKAQPPREDATIKQRLFFQGLVQEPAPLDYDQAAIDSALEWLKSDPPQPFVLFIPLIYPHVPFRVKDPYYSQYRTVDLPKRARYEDRTGYTPRFHEHIRREHGLERATEEDWDECMRVYYGMISRLDDQLGSIVDILKSPQYGTMWDKTYTMMFTDHGEYLGDYGLIEKFPCGVEEVLCRDPLIIAGPGLPGSQKSDVLCEMVDLTPTVLDLLGVEERYPHSGISLVGAMKDQAKEHKQYVFTEGGFLEREEPQLERSGFPYDKKAMIQHKYIRDTGRTIACRDRDWAYTYRIYEQPELYDRHNDPHELHNLAGDPDYRDVCARMKEAILLWMVETSDYVPYKVDDRFPKVDLVSTKEQIEARKRKSGDQATYSDKFNH